MPPSLQEVEVFVSYAHADDQPMVAGAPGWVTCFADHLQKSLGIQQSGSLVKLWTDHRIEIERALDEQLMRRVRRATCFVAVMSPRYVESKNCLRELDCFLAARGGGTGERVFIAEILPSDRQQWPRRIRELVSQRFWIQPFDQRSPVQLGWPMPDPRSDRDYWSGVRELAYAIAGRIRSVNVPDPPERMMKVWVATPADDMRSRWADLVGALRQQEFNVLHVDESIYWRRQDDFTAALEAQLTQAGLAVQLLGACAGRKAAGASMPLDRLQYEAARASAGSRGLSFLTWRSNELDLEQVADIEQRALLTGVIASGFEEFRQQVLARAAMMFAQHSDRSPTTGEATRTKPMTICVSAERSDQELGHRVADMLERMGTGALMTPEPDAKQVPGVWRQYYEGVLADSDALMIIYGRAPAIWVQSRLQAARKAIGAMRSGVWAAVLDGPPADKPEHGVRVPDLAVLDCRLGLAPEPLQDFVCKLRAATSGNLRGT